jgi:catechol 2,3-dioxygenase-like lactoylglutathione lyase family enzyme
MLLRIDCVMFRVANIDPALAFYRDVMGLVPRWREGNMAGLDFLHTRGTELVLHTDPNIPEVDVNYAVEDVAAALPTLMEAGCRVVAGPFPIAIGNCAVITDPFGTASRSWT